jgi:hypothetical protein
MPSRLLLLTLKLGDPKAAGLVVTGRCFRCNRPLQSTDRARDDFHFEDGACQECLDLLETGQAIADFPAEWQGTFAQLEADGCFETVKALKSLGTRFARGTL